jgi:hypothetical protein
MSKSSYLAAWSSYRSDYTSALSAGITASMTNPPHDYTSPICGSPTPISTIATVGPAVCAVNRATVQLLYWPAVRQTTDLCNNNASLATMTPTISGKPNTAVFEGTTLTSPTVYIAVDGTWRVETSGTTLTEHSTLILPQKSADVSSVCGISGGGYNTYAVNYADFGGPVPASAYRCQPRCNSNTYDPPMTNTSIIYSGFTLGNVTVPTSTRTFEISDPNVSWPEYATVNLCSTIWDDYRPALSIPAAFSSMNPAQGQCEFIFDDDSIFYDPPKALGERASIVKPTLPGTTLADPIATATPTPTPDPGSVPKPTTASATQLPIVETDPPAVSDQAPQSPDPETGTLVVPGKPSQSPDPGTDKPNVPADPSQPPKSGTDNLDTPTKPSQLPDPATNKPNVPGQSSQSPDPDTDDPKASNDASQLPDPRTGIADSVPKPSLAGSATTTPGSTAPGPTHDSQAGAAPIGIVITATNSQEVTVIQTQPAGPIVVGSATLTQGQSTDVDGVGQVVAGPSGLSIDTTYHTFTAIDPVDAGNVVAGSTTLAIGALIMAGLGSFAAGTDGATVDGTSTASTSPDSAPTNSAYVVAGNTFDAHATSAISLSPDVTLVPGGPPVSYASHVVSMASSGAYLVVYGTTQQDAPVETLLPTPTLDIGGTTYAADQASDFVVDGATLTRGGAIVADGTTVSLDASGRHVVVDGVTQSISAPAATTTASSSSDGSATKSSASESATQSSADDSATQSSADEGATESSASEAATESSAGGSATASNSASASNGGSALASSARSIAVGRSYVIALITMFGVCSLL